MTFRRLPPEIWAGVNKGSATNTLTSRLHCYKRVKLHRNFKTPEASPGFTLSHLNLTSLFKVRRSGLIISIQRIQITLSRSHKLEIKPRREPYLKVRALSFWGQVWIQMHIEEESESFILMLLIVAHEWVRLGCFYCQSIFYDYFCNLNIVLKKFYVFY